MRVIKRDGRAVDFDRERIIIAIQKAIVDVEDFIEVGVEEATYPYEIAEMIEKMASKTDLDVEKIQDIVEIALMQAEPIVAKEYILYRDNQKKKRQKGWEMNDLQRDIFEQKYENNKEGFQNFLDRVAKNNEEMKKLIRDKKFLPAGRILAGRGLQNEGYKISYSNCYVVSPPEDNLESIFDCAKHMARTFSYGGGVGTDLGELRPRNSKVKNAAKETSGAVSFADLYSLTTGLIGQSNRRGALMLSMPINHPDIEEFIDVKTNLDRVTKANISIRISDDFMEAVDKDQDFKLEFIVDSTNEKIEKTIRAKDLFMKLAKNNWDYAEPGMLYWDRIENYHLLGNSDVFKFDSTNPCGEMPLEAGGSCLLGSLNLSEFIDNPFEETARINTQDLEKAVRTSVRYLNEIMEEGIELHPLQEQRDSVEQIRRIGLGIMDWAGALIKLKVKYGSKKSIHLINQIGSLMANVAMQESALIAKELGTFPLYEDSIIDSDFVQSVATEETKDMIKKYGLRNGCLLSIAPTGSISTLLGCASGGIEPVFMNSYTRKTETLNGSDTYYKVYTPVVKEYMDKYKIQKESDLPDFFVTAMDLDYKDRIKTQAAWQKYIDASISSTVNVPNDFTVEQVADLYLQAWKEGLKGITIYRENCARTGILTKGKKEKTVEEAQEELDRVVAQQLQENPNQCPMCEGELFHSNGCKTCKDCGYSPCSI